MAGIINIEKLNGSLKTDCLNPYMGIFPCRCCVNCLAKRTNLWASRLMEQAKESLITLPFTLTYTDKQFAEKSVDAVQVIAGKERYIVSKTDIQKFNKRLNFYLKKIDPKARYKYMVKAEYGDLNFRPHYHCIIFLTECRQAITEHDLKKCVCLAWFNGIQKEAGEHLPNMARVLNAGKKIKENPFIEFEEFSQNLAKYATKYVAKTTHEQLNADSCFAPEFQLSSTKLGLSEQIREQCNTVASRLQSLVFTHHDLQDADFVKDFEKATTIFIEGRSFRIPQYLKSTIFKGYYKYFEGSCELSQDDLTLYKFYSQNYNINKEWRGSEDGERLYIEYQLMLNRYLDISLNSFMHNICADDYFVFETDDAVLYQYCKFLQDRHLQDINRKADNRIAGIKRIRNFKCLKRKQYEKKSI